VLQVLDARSQQTARASHAWATGIRARAYKPKQSWQASGLHTVQVKLAQPLMVASYLRGVTRKDDVEQYLLQDMLDIGGQGCLLVDRIIHEIAYKVGRAPKFGA
jgi:hypothetical protein